MIFRALQNNTRPQIEVEVEVSLLHFKMHFQNCDNDWRIDLVKQL